MHRVVDHPLAAAWLTELRATTTGTARARELVRHIAVALAWEATRDWPTRPVDVVTPVAPTTGVALAAQPLVVPVLRAGLWMLDGVLELFPDAVAGMAGLARDEETLQPAAYLDRLPPAVDGPVLILDPMLATGGTLCAVGGLLERIGATEVTALCLVAAPEGLARVAAAWPDWRVIAAAVDDHLDERGFIVPGLGDAGDRLCG